MTMLLVYVLTILHVLSLFHYFTMFCFYLQKKETRCETVCHDILEVLSCILSLTPLLIMSFSHLYLISHCYVQACSNRPYNIAWVCSGLYCWVCVSVLYNVCTMTNMPKVTFLRIYSLHQMTHVYKVR